jgi:hypothetical protein
MHELRTTARRLPVRGCGPGVRIAVASGASRCGSTSRAARARRARTRGRPAHAIPLITPLMFLGGAFYTIDMLEEPSWDEPRVAIDVESRVDARQLRGDRP